MQAIKPKSRLLGHTILQGKLAAALEPTKAIEKNPLPDDKIKFRSFLGLPKSIDGLLASLPEGETAERDVKEGWRRKMD